MKKTYLLLATTAMVMAGCANEDFVGETPTVLSENQPIGFNFSMPATTRAETNAGDAKTLNNEFIVWGEKAEADNKETEAENLVFENYRVQYKDNDGSTKNSTVSNTTGWDYVGIAPYASAKVSPAITTTSQTIKYWDLGKTYTFTAVSAKPEDISGDKVVIAKTQGSTSLTAKEKGYTITLKKGASAEDIFVAKRNVISTSADATSVSAVQMEFYNFQTKIRFGFYETVPGYKVKITGVKYDSKQDYVADKFGVDGSFITVPTSDDAGETVVYSVTYDANNIPVINVTTTQPTNNNVTATTSASYKEFGSNVFNKELGTTSNTSVVYDQDGGAWTSILPNNNNSTAMSFTVSYKLISEDTQEEIVVKDKKVTVPATYCQWKPNFAYTYLFKVSDSSTGLYPITFDACVVDTQTGNQETIAEVGEPSITTYAWDATNKKVITDKDEYEDGNAIYASVMESDAPVSLTDQNAFLYTVTSTAGTGAAPIISEASVANCLKLTGSNDTWTANDATGGKLEVKKETLTSTNYVKEVPREDGNGNRTLSALTWTAKGDTSKEIYYVVEYKKSDSEKYYKVIKIAKKSQE